MKKALLASGLSILCAGLVLPSAGCKARKAEYPERDITNVLVWGAGGGTDICNRMVAAEMGKILGVNINVVNKTGGVGGSVGMNDAYSRPHDGYTLCGLSESCVTAGVQGGFNKRMDVWDFFIIGGSPDVLSVSSASYENLGALIEAAKKNPGSLRAGASGAGSIHHLNLLALENGTAAKFNFIPYPGSAPTHNAALTREVEVVVTSISEQAQLIRSRKLRPLAVLTPEAYLFDEMTIPSAFDSYPALSQYLPISQAIGFAVPADVPTNVKDKLKDAFIETLQTESFKTWAGQNYISISGKTGEQAKQVFCRLESIFAWTLWELKAAKIDPASLKIPKP
jgi:tripartite-type tricarboxylate transporter receptor subunit TctC